MDKEDPIAGHCQAPGRESECDGDGHIYAVINIAVVVNRGTLASKFSVTPLRVLACRRLPSRCHFSYVAKTNREGTGRFNGQVIYIQLHRGPERVGCDCAC